MAEYMDTMKDASAKLWMFFKARQDKEKDSDQFWEESVNTVIDIAGGFKGTECEGYAAALAATYIEELQRLHVRAGGNEARIRDVLTRLIEKYGSETS